MSSEFHALIASAGLQRSSENTTRGGDAGYRESRIPMSKIIKPPPSIFMALGLGGKRWI